MVKVKKKKHEIVAYYGENFVCFLPDARKSLLVNEVDLLEEEEEEHY